METCKDGGEQYTLETNKQAKKSWPELRGVVNEFRRRLSGISDGSVPDSVTFRTLPDGRLASNKFYFTWIYFNNYMTNHFISEREYISWVHRAMAGKPLFFMLI